MSNIISNMLQNHEDRLK